MSFALISVFSACAESPKTWTLSCCGPPCLMYHSSGTRQWRGCMRSFVRASSMPADAGNSDAKKLESPPWAGPIRKVGWLAATGLTKLST